MPEDDSIDALIRSYNRIAIPNSYIAFIARENAEFQHGMLSLAACVSYDVDTVTEAFKKFAASRPWPWREAVACCLEYFREHGRFPFEIRDALDAEFVLEDILDAEVVE